MVMNSQCQILVFRFPRGLTVGSAGTITIDGGLVTLRIDRGHRVVSAPLSQVTLWWGRLQFAGNFVLGIGTELFNINATPRPTVINTNKYGGWAALSENRMLNDALKGLLMEGGATRVAKRPGRPEHLCGS